jgi:hypothetical protein
MSLYDLDFHAWSKEQADAIRRRSWNEIDWEHVAEEIEDLSRQWRNELKSRYVVLLMHLLKWAFQPGGRTKSWVDTVDEQRLRIEVHLAENPSLKSVEAEVFAAAYKQARLRAAKETHLVRSTFPEAPPFTVRDAKDGSFWPGEAPPRDWR